MLRRFRFACASVLSTLFITTGVHAGNLPPDQQKQINDSYLAGCLRDDSRALEPSVRRLVCRCEAGTVARETTREEFEALSGDGEVPERYRETLLFAREHCAS